MASSFANEQESLIGDDQNHKELAVITGEDLDEKPDNPKWAIFYFVMYTVFSTYNLIAGKFFRTWYPGMSTF